MSSGGEAWPRSTSRKTVSTYNLACFYALGEDAAQALDCLERAFALGFAHPEWLQHDPDLRSLQQHPRLRALLDRISGG